MIRPTRWLLLAAAVLAVPLLPTSAHATLPAGWTDADVGACSPAGTGNYDTPSGTFTLTGAGGGLGGTADSMNFCYQQYTGNFTFIARQTGNSDCWGGLMVRESLAANARAGDIASFAQQPTEAEGSFRSIAGDSATVPSPAGGLSFPNKWFRIDRAGPALYYSVSSDGTNWSPYYTQTVTGLSTSVYVGLTVNAYLNQSTKTATYDHVSLGALAPSNVTNLTPGTVNYSWIGNTFGNGDAYQQVQYSAAGMFVDTDGTCYANAYTLEVQRLWGIYKNGAVVTYRANVDGATNGGAAVAGDGTYVYYAEALVSGSTTSYGFDRVNKSTLAAASFTGGTGTGSAFLTIGTKTTGPGSPGNVWGLAVNSAAGVIYASDPLNGKIYPVTASTMTLGTAWTLPAGYAAYSLTWDASDSLLWATVKNTSTGVWQVWAYNASGVQQTGKTISVTDAGSTLADLTSLSYSGGHLYVADNGVDQNIKVYQSLSTTPTYWIEYGNSSFGTTGTGSGAGKTGSMLFNGLVAIGNDGSGNLYAMTNGYGPDLNETGQSREHRYGLKLESYNAGSRALNWRLQGLEFFDCVCIDPLDETSAYGDFSHYSLNFSNTTPGSEWSAVGNTLNDIKYPADYRTTASNIGTGLAGVFHVGSAKFLGVSDTGSLTGLYFYRFQSSAEGESAIPCGSITGNGASIWTDANGNGVQDSGETVTGSAFLHLYAPYFDTNGTLWCIDQYGINKLTCTVNSAGAPVYTASTNVHYNFSSLPGSDHITNVAGNGNCNRLVYDAAADTMYLMGFTTNYPAPAKYSGVGSAVICYTHWSTTPVFAWEAPVPIVSATDHDYNADAVRGWAGAGKYLFMQYVKSHSTLVMSKTNGAILGRIYPDLVTIGSIGLPDTSNCVNAFERSNGEYIITVEDDGYDKSVMYRWTGAP